MPSLSRGRCAWALVVSVGLVLGVLNLGATLVAQTARRSQPPVQQATRAWLEGQYDEVDRITATLDANDPAVAAIKARALIARGRYADADAALRPAAAKQPTSVAALELGLLEKMLGKGEAASRLRRVAADSPDQIAAGRALHALALVQGRTDGAADLFDEANTAFREGAARAPKDPELKTAWGELYLDAHQKAEALDLFQEALEADERWTPAILGAAQALADDDPPQAMGAAKKALEINPSYVEA